jgi:hypothetical protein
MPQTGPAGEYYVMSRLLLRDISAQLTPKNTPDVDIRIYDTKDRHCFDLQVKARRPGSQVWHMSPHHENIEPTNLLYCFVDFSGSLDDVDRCWIIPSKIVAQALRVSHAAWLNKPGRNGAQHAENGRRNFRLDYSHLAKEFGRISSQYGPNWCDPYINRWDLISPTA